MPDENETNKCSISVEDLQNQGAQQSEPCLVENFDPFLLLALLAIGTLVMKTLVGKYLIPTFFFFFNNFDPSFKSG